MMTAATQKGETVDAICWRMLGRTEGVTEQVLALNPGIAALGPKLPEGTKVQLPEISATSQPSRQTVSLWD